MHRTRIIIDTGENQIAEPVRFGGAALLREQAVIGALDPAAGVQQVSVKCAQIAVAAEKSEAFTLGRIGRHGMRLFVMTHLDPVFDIAQRPVGGRQRVCRRARYNACRG